MLGPGDNRYQFVHSDDLADARIRAGERPGAGTFNIGAEVFGTMREALTGLVRHAGTGSALRSLPMKVTERAMELTSVLGLSPLGPYHSLMYGREMFFDLGPARELLGWRATRSNDQMLAESCAEDRPKSGTRNLAAPRDLAGWPLRGLSSEEGG